MNSCSHSTNDSDSIPVNEESGLDESASPECFEFGEFHENLSKISPEICQNFKKPDIDYDDWSSIMSKVPEIVDAILGVEPSLSDSSSEKDVSLEKDQSTSYEGPVFFSKSGSTLWERYSASQDLRPLSWETSYTRQMFFMSLEIPMNLDKTISSSKKGKKEPILSIKTTPNLLNDTTLKNNSATENDPTHFDLDTQMIRILYLKTDGTSIYPLEFSNFYKEALSNLSLPLLKSHLLELEIIQEKSEKYLAYWTTQKEAIKNDKHMFEEVIESLVQHTKRQRIEHIKKIYTEKKK
ncbi:uncharacterized protein T551_00152 [Pneumocystis jirovecii RU7]|uniref:Uncharacterized protein n=1 Tax=Pneumocystis jirovecii (strain RU7) TaxID=1408657 RepID=A0A0W4ZWA4_PNEJ7|nr:uncharacterized protein T551_00152 [Pneumocystis jirovecii RU7]KTW32667.1 hypothetical protein T551_00152 [Pneumocystis jirovecii RU7]